MKKLLLYLVAIITLGTMSVDALAATKPVYIQAPTSNWTELRIWWDGTDATKTAQGMGYDKNGSDGKSFPDLLSSDTFKNVGATKVTGSDGNAYFKIELDESVNKVEVNYQDSNNNAVYNLSSFKFFEKAIAFNSNKYNSDGKALSVLFPSQGQDLTKNQFNIRINNSTWQGRKSADAEGSYTYENLNLTTASVNIQVFDKQSTEVYYSISGNQDITPGTAITPTLVSGSGIGNTITIQDFDISSTYSIKLTYKGDGKVTILVTKNQGETPGTDYSSYVAKWKAQGTGWGNEYTQNFTKEGIATFEVKTGNLENGFNLVIVHGNTSEYLYSGSAVQFEVEDGAVNDVTFGKAEGNNYIQVKDGLNKTFTVTINYPAKTILVSSGPVVDTYSWFPIVNGVKAEWTDSSNLSYTAASLDSFAVGLYKNYETTPTKTYGLNSTTVSGSANYTFKAGETAVTVNKGDYQDFTFTVTPGNGTAPDIDNVTVAVTSKLKDRYTWKPFVGSTYDGSTEEEWTSQSNGTYTFTAASLDGFGINLYKNGDLVAHYGHSKNTMGATEANHTLYKGNEPVAINNDGYQDFTFTFTPGEITSIPNDIKVNLTSTNKGDIVTGRAIYLGGTEGFATVDGVALKGGWDNYKDDANKLTDNGDGTYSKEVSLVDKTEFAVFIEGKSYSPGSGTNRFWLNSYVSKWDLDERATDYSMLIKKDFAKAIVTVWFEDGKPKMSVTDPDAFPVTVYFVNRAGWGKDTNGNQTTTPRCMNWTDKDVPEKFNNGIEFPGENMTKVGDSAEEDALKHQILGANYFRWKDDVWKFTLSNKYNEDGTFYRPKVIFSTGGDIDINQTRNLFLVANGIYTNAAGQNESDVKASELLPARIINDEGEVEVYPNTFHNTKYSTIYTSDPGFLRWAKAWTSSNTQRIGIQLTYEKDGETFTCTGLPGSTTMVRTIIGGKEFLRLDIAEDVIPDQTKVKELIIWELSGIGAYGSISLNEDGTFTVSGNPGVTHKLGNDDSGEEYTENGTDQTKDGKHHANSSDHHECFFSDCPLVFTNVYFRNGFVYNRDGIHSILEEVKPDALYIVSRGTGVGEDGVDHDFTLEGYPGTKLTINGVEKQAYRINATELLGRPQYVIPDVPYQAYFSFVGVFNNYTEADGTITTDKHILYAFPFENNLWTNDKPLYPGKPEAISADDNGFYSINRNGQEYDYYNVTVDWLTPAVSIAPAKQNAEFMLAIPNADTGVLEPRQNGFLYMYAMADNEYPVDPYTGEILYKDEETGKLQPVTEPSELRSRLCVVKYNKNIADEGFFDNVTVSMTRTNDYERYFRNNTANKPAYVLSTVDGEGYVRSGKALHAHKTPKGEAETGNKYRDVHLRAHTAGVAIVRITQDKAVTLSDGATYNPTEYAFPVRILPTPSSIGLELNGHGIYALDATGNLDLDPMTGQAPSYTYGVKCDNYEDTKTPGQTWSRERIKMEPNGCAYEVEDNNGQMMQTVKIYWDYEKPAEASRSRRSVVEAQASALTAYDVYYPIAFTEEQRFSRTHAISETKLKAHDNTVYMQIVHNGVVSPVYTVTVNAGENVSTDVNEVEVAEEVEPVYYNLNGVRVNGENLAKGIYVKVTGNRTEKIYVK